MDQWTHELVVERLRQGFFLFGDIGKELRFGLGDPSVNGVHWVPSISVELVKGLFAKGLLQPDAQPGRSITYRLRAAENADAAANV